MKKVILVFLLVLGLVSCQQGITGLGERIGGTIILNLEDIVTQRSLLPTQKMDISSYDVYGTLEDDEETFEELNVKPDEELVITNLTSGEWTIKVDGKNEDGIIIGSGKATAEVTPTSQTQASVSVTPIEGEGKLKLQVSWSKEAEEQMVKPKVNGEIIPYGGNSIQLKYDIDSENRIADFADVFKSGYYTLLTYFVDVEDNGDGTFTESAVAGNAEVVRIAADDTTTGKYYYDNINPSAGGDISLTISDELKNPLIIKLTPNYDGKNFIYGDKFEISATTESTTDTVEWTWYVNGKKYKEGETIEYLTKDFPKPRKGKTFFSSISAVGFSNGGTRGGSTTINITTTK